MIMCRNRLHQGGDYTSTEVNWAHTGCTFNNVLIRLTGESINIEELVDGSILTPAGCIISGSTVDGSGFNGAAMLFNSEMFS